MNRILLAITFVAVIASTYMGCEWQRAVADSNSTASALTEQQAVTETWRNKAGRYQAEKIAAEITYRDMKGYYEGEIQRMEKYLEVKPRTVKEYVVIEKQTADTIELSPVDTGGHEFAYRDEWADFYVSADGTKINLVYTVYDSILVASYYRHTGFLGLKRQLFVTGTSLNPNTEITGIRNLSITEKPKRFHLGLFTGYGVGPGGVGPLIGAGVTYSLLSF